MNPLLEQFLSESRDFLQSIGETLMLLEADPDNVELMATLFRMVHTLKGNSGLFDFPEMTRVLHAGEDLMDGVRDGRVGYSKALADGLLDAMDFVGVLCDEIEVDGEIRASHADNSIYLATALLQLLGSVTVAAIATATPQLFPGNCEGIPDQGAFSLLDGVPESVCMEAYRRACAGATVQWLEYSPAEECFFQGEDPFFQARNTPGLVWGIITARKPWPNLSAMNTYQCALNFHVLAIVSRKELDEYFRYMRDRIRLHTVPISFLVRPSGTHAEGPIYEDFVGKALDCLEVRDLAALGILARAQLDKSSSGLWLASALRWLLLMLELQPENKDAMAGLIDALRHLDFPVPYRAAFDATPKQVPVQLIGQGAVNKPKICAELVDPTPYESKIAASAGISIVPKSIKVDQSKIDRMMNLIGEIVVSKNTLPYLAVRAEAVFGSRELSREIKTQYSIINRIAEELQDAILQMRMMPVSVIFQRFPRLVRDTSNRLGKEVHLSLEGEETEAEKNIIESLGDPLIHIIRNSLDHGIEQPAVRRAAGKPDVGKLAIRAKQESDRIVIEISDDGKGIDPVAIKNKAYERGLIDQETHERLSDQDAINLVFAPGFSTMDVVSDLSGRGVGMDVVRSAVEKINGTIALESETGKGTVVRISLPLSMAITNVMIVEADGQYFGMPMDSVVETVRVSRTEIRPVLDGLAAVLRDRIVPLKSINTLLGLAAPPKPNAEDEMAVLVVHFGNDLVGLLVDDFHETVDIILKPMAGLLAGISAYSGSALLGDGSVLMVLNVKEIL